MAVGTGFARFCFEVGRPRVSKTYKNWLFFNDFAIPANLPTRGHLIDFLINLALNLKPKTLTKSTQETSKIDQKSHRKQDASWLGIWTPLGTIFGGFWLQVGRQVGAKLAPKSKKWRSQDDVKKSSKIWRRSGQQPENVLASNNTTILTILTVLAAGSWLAVQSPIDTPVGRKARGRIYIYIYMWDVTCYDNLLLLWRQ